MDAMSRPRPKTASCRAGRRAPERYGVAWPHPYRSIFSFLRKSSRPGDSACPDLAPGPAVWRGLLAACLLAACLLLVGGGLPLRAEPLRLVTSEEYPPYHGRQLPGGGPVAELMRVAFQRAGYDCKFDFVPWARALAETKSGKADAVVGVWYTAERETYLMYSAPIGVDNKIGFYRRTDRPIEPLDPARLRSLKIAVVRGYANPASVIQGSLSLVEANSDQQMLDMVLHGRADLAVVDWAVGQYLLTASPIAEARQQLTWIDPPLEIRPQFVGFSRARPESAQILRALNEALAAMRQDGSMTAITRPLQVSGR